MIWDIKSNNQARVNDFPRFITYLLYLENTKYQIILSSKILTQKFIYLFSFNFIDHLPPIKKNEYGCIKFSI